jgi:hypothetical protein
MTTTTATDFDPTVFDAKLALFLDGVRAKIDAYWTACGYTHTRPMIETMEGQRYIRIVSADKKADGSYLSRSCWGFIDKTNGDVLKSGGWKAPAKHPRGNIFNTEFALANCQWTGPNYLR